jgi:hypothetical protein
MSQGGGFERCAYPRVEYLVAMLAVATLPAWMPSVPSVPANLISEASINGSSEVEAQTASGQPMMSYDELWGMIERNMGQPLTRVNLGDK